LTLTSIAIKIIKGHDNNKYRATGLVRAAKPVKNPSKIIFFSEKLSIILNATNTEHTNKNVNNVSLCTKCAVIILFGLKIIRACKSMPNLLENCNKRYRDTKPVKYRSVHCIATIATDELSIPRKKIGIAKNMEYKGVPNTNGSSLMINVPFSTKLNAGL
jgi:hypothetical protein